MWPWEHLAFGYIVYSSLHRLMSRRHPGETSALALGLGTQLPDLIDKPLAWGFNVLPYGRSLSHSIFTATVVCILGLVWGSRSERSRPAVAFCIGYLSHLAGDVFYPVMIGSSPNVAFVLWPLSERPPQPTGFLFNVRYFVRAFLSFLGTPMGAVYLFLEFGLMGTALALWSKDGTPGSQTLTRVATVVLESSRH